MTTAIETIERPILFSGPMVRAILADEKRQTRREVKLDIPPESDNVFAWPGDRPWKDGDTQHGLYAKKHPTSRNSTDGWLRFLGACPYGGVGDRLWVRETWASTRQAGESSPWIVYRADDPDWSVMDGWKWQPSIFMKRAACRLVLEITEIRVERIQEITEADAIAEGVRHAWDGLPKLEMDGSDARAIAKFRAIWKQINGIESWESNPWVWVVSFKRVKE